MGVKVMLSLDLERGVSDENRTIFNECLAKLHWKKIPKVTTTWQASFTDGVSEADAIQETKKDVANSAKAAGITKYEAVVHVGPNLPTPFRS